MDGFSAFSLLAFLSALHIAGCGLHSLEEELACHTLCYCWYALYVQVSHEVAPAPRTLSLAVPSLVTPPMPAVRSSIYGLIKKPLTATCLAPSTSTPSARPAPIVALVAQSESKDGETSGKMASDTTAPSADAKMSELSTASEENRIVK